MEHLEPFIDLATASLRSQLDVRIDVINGENGDFELPKPLPEAYVPGGVDVIVHIPTVEVAAPDWSVVNPDIEQRGWDGNYVLMVRLWYEHADYNVLWRSLYRYGRALTEVLGKRDALGKGVKISQMRGSYRTNPETNERMALEGGALVVISFQTVELVP